MTEGNTLTIFYLLQKMTMLSLFVRKYNLEKLKILEII